MDRNDILKKILLELIDNNLLNEFINIIFNYKLKNDDIVYIQYKIVKEELILDIFDNSENRKFNVYVFKKGNRKNPIEIIKEQSTSINYINMNACYKEYKKNNKTTNIIKLGALFKVKNKEEFNEIINNIFPKEINIKNIIKKETKQ